MSLNPPFSPDSIQATTSLSHVMDKEMQETMVRCHTELKDTNVKDDLREKGQCRCWDGGGAVGNVVELSWKTAFQRSRYNLELSPEKVLICLFLEGSFWFFCGLVFC